MNIDYEIHRDKLLAELKLVLEDAEKLIREATNAPAEGFAVLRTRLDKKLGEAKARLDRTGAAIGRQTKHAADAAQVYAKENPWKSLAALAVTGAIIGLVLTRR